MNKLALVYALLAVATITTVYFSAHHNKEEFEKWKREFGIGFSEQENIYRQYVFYKNLQEIKSHNSDKSKTYEMGLNQFSALTHEQFVKLMLNPKPYNPEWENVDVEFKRVGADIDWTTKGAVSPVKNQGNCGSCWAFSAVGVLQSFYLMKGQSTNLAEQQLVDCSGSEGNHGCNGGFNYRGLAYVKAHGITTTSAYPYVARNQACHVTGGDYKIANVLTTKGCTQLQDAIQSRPLGVSVDATNWSAYRSGIFNNCGTKLDHDVLLVGVTSTYWKIKNSWGTSWGETGFIRLAPGNTCGICVDLSPWVA